MWNSENNEVWSKSLQLALELICEYLPWRTASEICDPSSNGTDIVTLRRVMFRYFRRADASVDDIASGTGCSRQSIASGVEKIEERMRESAEFAAFVRAFEQRYFDRYNDLWGAK